MSRSVLTNLAPLVLFLFIFTGSACAKPEAQEAQELEIGAEVPAFNLKGVDGDLYSPDFKEAKALVVVFTCLSCPVARAYEDRILEVARDYQEKGVRFVAIMPNDPKIVPADAFDRMKARAAEKDYPFPFVVDEKQEVAKAFGARVTPHLFVFSPDGKLAYRGRIDDSTDPAKVTQSDLRNALDNLVADQEVAVASTKAFGCSIKWKKDKSS
jgi:peroxiredoxin